MNKILSFLFVIVFIFAISATFVSAQEEYVVTSDAGIAAVMQTEITTQDLGVEDPGILPTSRFYFLKNLSRGINRIFTFNPVKKAELELNIANEQAAEIQKMKEVAPERTDAIARAADNYQQNVERLKTRLDALKETSQNPNVDKLMEKLVDRSVKHQQLFDELKQKFEDKPELKQRFGEMQDKINEAIVKIPEKFDSPEVFKERMKKAIEARPEGVFKELRAMEMIGRIEEKLPQEQRAQLEGATEDFMKKFEGRMGNLPENQRKEILRPELFEKFLSDPERRLKIMEEMKDRVQLPMLKQEMDTVQGKILERAVQKGEIGKEKSEEQINRAEKALTELEAKISDKVKTLATQAKNHLELAKKSLAEEKYGEAFGHATTAEVIIRNALKLLTGQLPPPTGILPPPQTGTQQPPSGEQIVCTQEYLPVCGADEKTYPNKCYAQKAGVIIKAPGVCQIIK